MSMVYRKRWPTKALAKRKSLKIWCQDCGRGMTWSGPHMRQCFRCLYETSGVKQSRKNLHFSILMNCKQTILGIWFYSSNIYEGCSYLRKRVVNVFMVRTFVCGIPSKSRQKCTDKCMEKNNLTLFKTATSFKYCKIKILPQLFDSGFPIRTVYLVSCLSRLPMIP